MLRKALRRLGIGVGLVFAVVTITFLLINLAPGDPARLWVAPNASEADLAAARRLLGLDQPLPVRYVTWLVKSGASLTDWVEISRISPILSCTTC